MINQLLRNISQMEDAQDVSRATVVGMKTEDFNQVEQIAQDLLSQKILKLESLLEKSEKFPLLREQIDLLQSIFGERAQLVLEMIQWMFQPTKIMARKQLLPDTNNNQKYPQPYRCLKFIEKNYYFYEKMYQSAKTQQIPISLWFNFLFNYNKDEQNFSTCLGYFHDVMIPFVAHDYHANAYLSLSSNLRTVEPDPENSIIRIFPKHLTDSLIQICEIQVIFKFLYKLVIASCCQGNQKQRADEILNKLYDKLKNPSKSDAIINHLCILFKEIHDNIFNDNIGRATLFIQALVKSQITTFCIDRVSNSFLCRLDGIGQEIQQQKIYDEEEAIQNYLKFLTLLLTIYSKLYKENRVATAQSRVSSCVSITSSPEPKKYTEQEQIFDLLEGQIGLLIKSLSSLNKLVSQPMERSIDFSSGQNIKPLTIYKLCYFQLLLQCLHIAKDFPQKFVIDMDKLDIFSLIQRYLSQNRWNNIFHHTLEKITTLLLVNNYNFFKKNNMEKSNMANSFLGFLTENFNNKDYIYLNTFNFTHQGNLHSLYKIAKTLAHQLNNNQILVQLFDSFEPWKRFVLVDLKRYEERTFDTGVKIEQQQLQKQQWKQKHQKNINVAIDQADSIKKLISNITFTQKWPNKFSIRKKRISSALHRGTQAKSLSKKKQLEKDCNSPLNKIHLSENKAQISKQLLMSYPPILGKINLQAQSQHDNSQEKARIGKYFFTRAVSNQQLQRNEISQIPEGKILQKSLSSKNIL